MEISDIKSDTPLLTRYYTIQILCELSNEEKELSSILGVKMIKWTYILCSIKYTHTHGTLTQV